MLGMRAEDVLVAARYLAKNDVTRGERVSVIAVGSAGLPALHAAALEPVLINKLELDSSPGSWSDYLKHPETPGQMVNSVHGGLRVYDLPDLVELLGSKLSTRAAAPGGR
jgi:hypothetical protein